MSKSNYFSVHSHSQFSTIDGMTKVPDLVAKVARYGHPAFVLMDHGGMGGTVQAYKACKAAGIKFFPAVEIYLIDPEFDGDLEDSGKAKRFHMGLIALSERGYMALVEIVSKSHTRPRFNRFPRMTLSDIAELGQDHGEHIAITTGCFFGYTQQVMLHEGVGRAEKFVKMLANWFPHTFVEVQHHNIDHIDDEGVIDDNEFVRCLMDIAEHLDLPVVATQDSHYTDSSQAEVHKLMKRMVYGGVEDEFPGDSFHLASGDWVAEHYTDEQWERCEEGYAELLSLHDVKITPLDKYIVDVPTMSKNPQRVIEKDAWAEHRALMKELKPSKAKQKRYEKMLTEECSVIGDLGMFAYLEIWRRFVRWCRREQICIEARGSANGSYLCYLLGITQVDAVEWDCMFERFLSRDRTKPPDVDMDIEDMRRQDALAWLANELESCQIGTWSKMGITINEQTGEEKGSVFTTWISGRRRECLAEGMVREEEAADLDDRKPTKKNGDEIGKALFKQRYAWMQGIPDVRKVSTKEYKSLRKMAEMNSVFRSYGVHAGGVLLSGDNVLIQDYIPTMLVASSNTRVSMYDMDDVEEFGILKMDLLGQTSLTVMRICQQLMELDDPTDFTWIPLEDREALHLLRTGKQDTGIFHFEGYTKSKGGKELGVKSVKDAILVQALYMPGCMDVAPGQDISMKDLYLRRRKRPQEREHITYLHPAFEKVLAPTYGCVVFQEQVIAIMRELGMSIASINKFFKVVKDSGKGATERNKVRMAEVRDEFDAICEGAGIDPDEAWSATASFVSYGFNKNHATGYGIRSYRTAYLKAHHTAEYMTALLIAWAGKDKEKLYLREARRCEIPLLPPDVNISTDTYTLDRDRGVVRRGLVSIAGIGKGAAQEIAKNRPYQSIEDFSDRVNGRIITGIKDFRDGDIAYEDVKSTSIFGKLRDAGVLDSLTESG